MNPGGGSDLTITVGGDISPFEEALGQIPQVAEQAFGQVQTAIQAVDWSELTNGLDQVATGLASLSQSTEAVLPAIESLDEQLSLFGSDAETAGNALGTAFETLPETGQQLNLFPEYAGQAAQSLTLIPPPLSEIAPAAKEASDSLGTLLEAIKELAGTYATFEGLKEVLVGSTEAFGEFQRIGEALTIITKDASGAADALERIPALADAIGQSVPALEDATVKFARYGVALDAIPPLLESIANASVGANVSFDTVATSFERMTNTGILMQRSLQSSGLQMADIAQAMGMVGASTKEVIAAFKDLGDGAEGAAARAKVLTDATSNIAGAARATADDVTGSWNKISNAIHEALVNIGASLGGFQGLTQAAGLGIKFLEDIFLEFVGVCKVVADVVIALGGTIATVFSGIAKASLHELTGNFTEAADDIKTMTVQIGSYWSNFTANLKQDWADTGTAIAKVWDGQSATLKAMVPQLKAAADGHHAAAAAAIEHATALQQINDVLDKLDLSRANKAIQDQAAALDHVRDTWASARAMLQLETDALNSNIVSDEEYKGILDQIVNGLDRSVQLGGQYADLLKQQGDGVMTMDSALKALNIDSDSAVQKQLDLISAAYDFVLAAQKVGAASAEEAAKASDAYTAAVVKIAGGTNTVAQAAQTVSDSWDKAIKKIDDAIEGDLSKAFSDIILQTGGVSAAFVKLGKDVLSIILDTIMKQAFEPLMKGINEVVKSLFAAFGSGGVAETVVKNTSSKIQEIGSQTVSSIQQMGSSAISALSSIFSMVTGALSAIASIVSAFELAHTNTLLTRIEASTRRMDIVIEQDSQYVQQTAGWLNLIHGDVVTIRDTFPNIVTYLQEIANNGGGGGGGGGGGNSSLGQTVQQLEESLTALKENVNNLSLAVAPLINSSTAVTTAANSTGTALTALGTPISTTGTALNDLGTSLGTTGTVVSGVNTALNSSAKAVDGSTSAANAAAKALDGLASSASSATGSGGGTTNGSSTGGPGDQGTQTVVVNGVPEQFPASWTLAQISEAISKRYGAGSGGTPSGPPSGTPSGPPSGIGSVPQIGGPTPYGGQTNSLGTPLWQLVTVNGVAMQFPYSDTLAQIMDSLSAGSQQQASDKAYFALPAVQADLADPYGTAAKANMQPSPFLPQPQAYGGQTNSLGTPLWQLVTVNGVAMKFPYSDTLAQIAEAVGKGAGAQADWTAQQAHAVAVGDTGGYSAVQQMGANGLPLGSSGLPSTTDPNQLGSLMGLIQNVASTAQPVVNLNVNLSGSVLTGANGMDQLTQQISAAMVNQLARMGIRMTRG